jgi:hypothetical protein
MDDAVGFGEEDGETVAERLAVGVAMADEVGASAVGVAMADEVGASAAEPYTTTLSRSRPESKADSATPPAPATRKTTPVPHSCGALPMGVDVYVGHGNILL